MAPLATIAILSHLFIVCLILSSVSFNGVNGKSIASKQREFDYFILALQWPGTYCQRTKKCCKSNGCCRGANAPMEFTIHGLWPNYNDGSWPSCCTESAFDENEISTLRSALMKYWPSLSCSSPSTCHGHKGSFWAHEYEKHGTCASSVLGDEYNYFLTTLNVYFKYNITKVLSEAGYAPSDSEKYPVGGIISAIENAYHISPQIICSHGAIQELRLCFYKDFKPRDCASTNAVEDDTDSSLFATSLSYLIENSVNNKVVSSGNSCPKYVSLPTYSSSGVKFGRPPSRVQPKLEAM